jgi:D-glycero-alpha-D-manno-heptose-7-phosphate kinase
VDSAVTRAASAAAPVRLDFAGGWTDVPPFSAREGGTVVAATIALYARAEVRPGAAGLRLDSRDLGETVKVADATRLDRGGPLALLSAGVRLLPVDSCTVRTASDAPPGSGLGSSGALDVALVAALAAARGESPGAREVADLACRLELAEAGIPGGRQDQFASTFGGFLRLGFRDPAAEMERLQLDSAFASELERRMVLCYTGASHFSGGTIARVMQAYQRGDSVVTGALHALRDIAERMAEALSAADLGKVGALLSENWRQQLALDPAMCTAEMGRLEAVMSACGALGGKAAGSGAGGCMFFLAADDPGPAVAAARDLGMRMLPVRWALDGVRLC